MLFNSFPFIFIFLPACLFTFFLARQFGSLKTVVGSLILSSLVFYSVWNPVYLALLLGSITGNFFLGRVIQTSRGKFFVTLGVAANLCLLAYFKYVDFFLDTSNALLATNFPSLNIVLPLGISFFTFQQISFLVECHRRTIDSRQFLDYCLFVAFFPQLIAGPIVRYQEITPQFATAFTRAINWKYAYLGLVVFTIGLSKKVILADSASVTATQVFTLADLGQALTPTQAWSGLLSYSFQIYFDFSAYSDMAIGLALMMGLRLPQNFLSPYKAKNFSEFWQRWHITLSRFLRDYLYIPLGGNRRSALRTKLNLFVVMALGGLWHGAHWNFMIWGALHGIYLIISHLLESISGPEKRDSRIVAFAKVGVVFLLATLAWAFFRAETTAGAIRVLQPALGLHGGNWDLYGIFRSALLPLWYFFILTWLCPNTSQIADALERVATGSQRLLAVWLGSLFVALLLACSLFVLFVGRDSEFIYFQF